MAELILKCLVHCLPPLPSPLSSLSSLPLCVCVYVCICISLCKFSHTLPYQRKILCLFFSFCLSELSLDRHNTSCDYTRHFITTIRQGKARGEGGTTLLLLLLLLSRVLLLLLLLLLLMVLLLSLLLLLLLMMTEREEGREEEVV